MDSSTVLVLALAAVLVLAGVMIIVTGRRRAGVGRLSGETKKADAPPEPSASTALATTAQAPDEADLDAEARARAEASRGSLEPVGGRAVAERVPVDEEELGVTRRQFFNRGILLGQGLAVGGFGIACLAFLWPTRSGGLGTKVTVGTVSQVKEQFDKKLPYYNASAKTYIVAYPEDDIEKAKKVYAPNILSGMEQGYVALSQKCPHLGCRVPWCETSQWFECPCHGSKYNRVGEKRGGPAPRGMDRWPLEVSGNSIVVDTSGTVVTGPPIGTDTTGQGAEGPPCV